MGGAPVASAAAAFGSRRKRPLKIGLQPLAPQARTTSRPPPGVQAAAPDARARFAARAQRMKTARLVLRERYSAKR
jgi:hypothetical protein